MQAAAFDFIAHIAGPTIRGTPPVNEAYSYQFRDNEASCYAISLPG